MEAFNQLYQLFLFHKEATTIKSKPILPQHLLVIISQIQIKIKVKQTLGQNLLELECSKGTVFPLVLFHFLLKLVL